MQVGLRSLVHEELAAYAEESRAFYAARGERRGPASLEELHQMRAKSVVAAISGQVTVEHADGASGSKIPLRLFAPKKTRVRGVSLDIPGGGFYLSAAGNADTRNRDLAESLGIAVVCVD